MIQTGCSSEEICTRNTSLKQALSYIHIELCNGCPTLWSRDKLPIKFNSSNPKRNVFKDILLICTYILLITDFCPKFSRLLGFVINSKRLPNVIKWGYNLDIIRQSACLVLNPITVYRYGFLFNCTMMSQTSDSMMALT